MFKETPKGQTHFYDDNCGDPKHNNLKHCKKCWAYYRGEHNCDGLMKLLVKEYNKKHKST